MEDLLISTRKDPEIRKRNPMSKVRIFFKSLKNNADLGVCIFYFPENAKLSYEFFFK